jgi:hypothetical protein
MHAGVLVAAGVALLGAVVALVWLPARASYDALAEEHADADVPVEVAKVTDPAVATRS